MTQLYTARDYSHLTGLQGITDDQIELHVKLYQGYVNRTNGLLDQLQSMAEGGHGGAAWQELKRRLGWEFDGMRLHEYYFDNMKGGTGALEEGNAFAARVARDFGSVERWKTDLMATAEAPGVGWAITYLDEQADRVLNFWVSEHHGGHPAGCRPLLVMDLWEHAWSAYLKPTERARYLEDFWANVDWDVVAERL